MNQIFAGNIGAIIAVVVLVLALVFLLIGQLNPPAAWLIILLAVARLL